jgi:hypothetical protein
LNFWQKKIKNAAATAAAAAARQRTSTTCMYVCNIMHFDFLAKPNVDNFVFLR